MIQIFELGVIDYSVLVEREKFKIAPPLLGVNREKTIFTPYMGDTCVNYPNPWGSTLVLLVENLSEVMHNFPLRFQNLKILCFFRVP
jgi:hypothetical protein